jgi:hypothetical protein
VYLNTIQGALENLLDFEDFLLIIATTAWLSTLKIIRLFFKCIPQMCRHTYLILGSMCTWTQYKGL